MPYDPTIPEEELKTRVARDAFAAFDCARIFGKVDFCVSPKVDGPMLWETESLLWAEAKKGVRADYAPLFAQLVLTVGGERTYERHSPPPFLGAGRALWRHYHAQPGALPDASFYDIRAFFQGFKPNGHMNGWNAMCGLKGADFAKACGIICGR